MVIIYLFIFVWTALAHWIFLWFHMNKAFYSFFLNNAICFHRHHNASVNCVKRDDLSLPFYDHGTLSISSAIFFNFFFLLFFVAFLLCFLIRFFSCPFYICVLLLYHPHLDKNLREIKEKRKEKNLIMETVALHSESCSKSFYPFIISCKFSLQGAIDPVQGL